MQRREVVERNGAAALVPELAAWDDGVAYDPGLHAGDLGWHLRLADEVLAGTVHVWWDDGGPVALGLLEGSTARVKARPDRLGDRTLAHAVADALEAMPGERLATDVDPGSALRAELTSRGWTLDPDTWAALYADGERWQPADRGEVRLGSEDVPGRVAVQRNGFVRSTFDEPSWHRMAAGPGFRPDLDVVVLGRDGTPAAAGIGWLSVPGGPAVVEPLATHPDHRGQGLGRAAVGAIVDACLAAGASGVSVCTPTSNQAGVATYVAAGFRPIETLQGLVLER